MQEHKNASNHSRIVVQTHTGSCKKYKSGKQSMYMGYTFGK